MDRRHEISGQMIFLHWAVRLSSRGMLQTQEATAVAQQHPPGINGFQQNEQSQAAAQQQQNPLGSTTAGGLPAQQ
jgi:hypothetical protein